MQLINFCLEPFVQRVECGCVCADEQSPHNLISTNPRLRTRGCRVEHFIRPPVHLEFQFSAPVHVACILVRPSLTESTEARIEIAGSLNLSSSEGHYYKPCGNSLIKGENSVLVFRNKVFERKFGEMKFASELSVLGSSVVSSLVCLQLIEQPMKHSHVLYTMKCLKLSVAHFTGHKPAAIQSLEVWGILSQSCSALEKETAQRLIADLQAKPPFSNPLDCNMGVYNSHRQHKTNPLQINPLDHNSFESQINSDEIHGTQSHGAQSHGAQSCGTQSHGTGDFRTHCTLSPCGYLMKYAHLEECCVRDQTGMEEDSHMKGLTKRRRFLGIHQPVSTQLASRNPTRIPCIVLPPDNSEPLLDTQLDRGSNSNKPHSIGSKLQAVTSCSIASFGVPAPQQGEGKKEALKSRGAVTVDTCVRCPGGHDPIPEKFLDEITCDVMAVPMLLPSGHYVDKDTLDKLMHTDAIYGRIPSDPFTGLPFTESSKPTFSAQLKVQLDHFLSTQGEGQLHEGGRTLGSAADISKHLQRLQGRAADNQIPMEGLAKKPKLISTEDEKVDLRECYNNTTPLSALKKSSKQGHTANESEGTTSVGDQTAGSRMRDHTHEAKVASSLNRALQDLSTL